MSSVKVLASSLDMVRKAAPLAGKSIGQFVSDAMEEAASKEIAKFVAAESKKGKGH
jgi:uncharacterized protein (DUF1778 family)